MTIDWLQNRARKSALGIWGSFAVPVVIGLCFSAEDEGTPVRLAAAPQSLL